MKLRIKRITKYKKDGEYLYSTDPTLGFSRHNYILFYSLKAAREALLKCSIDINRFITYKYSIDFIK